MTRERQKFIKERQNLMNNFDTEESTYEQEESFIDVHEKLSSLQRQLRFGLHKSMRKINIVQSSRICE